MATFHINRGGTNLGTFSEDEVRDGLRSGKFFGTDLGWREGMATWEPLAQISEFAKKPGPVGRPAHNCNSPAAAALLPRRQSRRAPAFRGMIGSNAEFCALFSIP
jgi:hypothetical protein